MLPPFAHGPQRSFLKEITTLGSTYATCAENFSSSLVHYYYYRQDEWFYLCSVTCQRSCDMTIEDSQILETGQYLQPVVARERWIQDFGSSEQWGSLGFASCSGSLMAILPYYVSENYSSDMWQELSFPYNIMLVNGFQFFFWGLLTIYLYGFYLFPWRTSFNNMYKGNWANKMIIGVVTMVPIIVTFCYVNHMTYSSYESCCFPSILRTLFFLFYFYLH